MYGDIQEEKTRNHIMTTSNTSMTPTNEPTFVLVPPNETDNYPPGSMKVIQMKKVETTH